MASAIPQKSDFRTSIDLAVRGALLFVEEYYKMFDNQRHYLKGLYNEKSAVVWCGNGLLGAAAYLDFVHRLPFSQHEIRIIDSQPTVDGPAPPKILCTVHGRVKYGQTGDWQDFHQAFLLSPGDDPESSYYVASDCFRLV